MSHGIGPTADLPLPPTPCRTRDLPESVVLRAMLVDRGIGIGHAFYRVGWPWAVVEQRLGRMCDKGLIEYGVSIATPWLTDKGRIAAMGA